MAYSRYRISHKKELYYILCIVAVAVILLFSFFGPDGYRELRKRQFEVQQHREQVENLKRGNSERRKTIEGLRSNPQAQEAYARKKGYGREGEIVQELPPENETKPK